MQTFQYVRHQKGKKETLIQFLYRRFPYQNIAEWNQNIVQGNLKVNNKLALPEYILETKDIITYQRSREQEPKIDPQYKIIHQDEWIVVVEKSGNIPVSESGKFYQNTLVNLLKEKEGYKELYPVHRLDRETSGVLVLSKQKQVATFIGKQFADNLPKKIYYAILVGRLQQKELEVEQPIQKVNKDALVRIRQIIHKTGKFSKTRFTECNYKNGLSLVKIQTLTGRTHQIRCHAEYLHTPILGDKLYGQTDEKFLSLIQEKEKPYFYPYGIITRQLLHASLLQFIHPKTKQKISFESNYKPFFAIFPNIKTQFNLTF